MPKKLDPHAKAFQPIEKAFLSEALADSPAMPAAAPPLPPAATAPAPTKAPLPEKIERKVVQLPREEEAGEDEHEIEESARRATADRLTRVLKARVSASEQSELSRIVNQLSASLDTPVSTTHVIRALITILRHSEPQVIRRARQHGPLRRPSNDDLTAIAAFEFRLAKLISAALRDAPPLRELPRE